MTNAVNLMKIRAEAQDLGITIDRDDDGTFWGKAPSGLELGGYETSSQALEDLKAVVALDGAKDIFSYEDDPDAPGTYRVTYLPDGMIFNDRALAVACADAISYYTSLSTPKAAPKRGVRTKKPTTIEAKAEPTVEETLPDPKTTTMREMPNKIEPSVVQYPDPADLVEGAERKPKKETVKANLIRSENGGIRSPETLENPNQKIADALNVLAKALTEAANSFVQASPLLPASPLEEEDEPKPARNRRSSY